MTHPMEQQFVFRDKYPERIEIYNQFDTASEKLRSDTPALLEHSYGDHPRMRYDLFYGQQDAPLVVFIHGGYWQSLSKERYSFVARPFLEKGLNVLLPGYPLAPDVNIPAMIGCIQRAILSAVRHLENRGNLPSWALTGHSAGGHLAAAIASEPCDLIPPPSVLAPISGIFDLLPIISTSLNEKLLLDQEKVRALNPLTKQCSAAQAHAFVGESETPEFIRQSSEYVAQWATNNRRQANLTKIKGANHYSILCNLLQNNSTIAHTIMNGLDG